MSKKDKRPAGSLRRLKDWPGKDPAASEEEKKYEHPIPSRAFILHALDELHGHQRFDGLARKLGLAEERDIDALQKRLRAMVRDGQLLLSKDGVYSVVEQDALVEGRVQGHPDGYGFLIPDKGGDDFYLSESEMQKALDGDRALVRPLEPDHRGRSSAIIVQITQHANETIVGRFLRERGHCYIEPDSRRIPRRIPVEITDGLNPVLGDIVVASVKPGAGHQRAARGVITEVLGSEKQAGIEVEVAIRKYGLPHQWSEGVEAEMHSIPDTVRRTDWQGRTDLRALPLVTIDGEDARDFDDAVFCARDGSGFRLVVAIADVSHYVKPQSPLDRAAYERGNSVYFPDHVVPMLPEKLSNGLCSLNPHVDRLCMVCDMRLDSYGKVARYQFYPSVMHSHARLTYTQVGALIDEPDSQLAGEVRDTLGDLEASVWTLYEAYTVLRAAREKRGALDLDSTETRILFTRDRKIERIYPVVRNTAHKLIEECMLAANVCAANLLLEHRVPIVFRNHEKPSEEKVEILQQFLNRLGIELHAPGKKAGGKLNAHDFQHVLEQIAQREDRHVIQTVLLRSMRQAVYEAENKGHFGLNYEAYTHFTSPIRRYPDLLVHRAIRAILAGEAVSWSVPDMIMAGEHCSITERRADEATRDVEQWLKCIYMADHVGDVFEAVVSGVTQFGLFVEVKDLYVEGLVHVSTLPPDYYSLDEASYRLVASGSGESFGLGDVLVVRLAAVNVDDRKIDFVPERSELAPTQHRSQRNASRKLQAGKGKKQSKQGAAKSAGKKTSGRPSGDSKTSGKAKNVGKSAKKGRRR